MAKRRSTEEAQLIVTQVEEAVESGMSVVKAAEKVGVNPWVYRRYKKMLQTPSMDDRQIKQVNTDKSKHLKAENLRLRQIVADLMLDLHALKEWAGR